MISWNSENKPLLAKFKTTNATIPEKLIMPIGGINLLKKFKYGSQTVANIWPNLD